MEDDATERAVERPTPAPPPVLGDHAFLHLVCGGEAALGVTRSGRLLLVEEKRPAEEEINGTPLEWWAKGRDVITSEVMPWMRVWILDREAGALLLDAAARIREERTQGGQP